MIVQRSEKGSVQNLCNMKLVSNIDINQCQNKKRLEGFGGWGGGGNLNLFLKVAYNA